MSPGRPISSSLARAVRTERVGSGVVAWAGRGLGRFHGNTAAGGGLPCPRLPRPSPSPRSALWENAKLVCHDEAVKVLLSTVHTVMPVHSCQMHSTWHLIYYRTMTLYTGPRLSQCHNESAMIVSHLFWICFPVFSACIGTEV